MLIKVFDLPRLIIVVICSSDARRTRPIEKPNFVENRKQEKKLYDSS